MGCQRYGNAGGEIGSAFGASLIEQLLREMADVRTKCLHPLLSEGPPYEPAHACVLRPVLYGHAHDVRLVPWPGSKVAAERTYGHVRGVGWGPQDGLDVLVTCHK